MDNENELHLTCEGCKTVYRLAPAQLGVTGRRVRCMQCKTTWYQPPPEGAVPPAPTEAPVETAAEPPAPTPVPEWEIEERDDLTFRPTEKGQYFLEEDMRVIPEAVKPTQAPDMAQISVMTHRPMGMGAMQYGIFVFLLLAFATLSGMMVFRAKIVDRLPLSIALYQALHIPVSVPGEGLAFSAMVAENRVVGGKKTLAVEAKLANISDHEQAYPALKIAVKGTYGATLKEWRFRPDAGKKLASGENTPVKMVLKDAPADGKSVELTVTGN